jgi:group I intron endonuclease
MSIIYKTTNSINGKIYIGKAKFNDPNYLGSGVLLAKAIKKYKRESFIKEVLEECTNDAVNGREIYWISFFNSTNNKIGYNLTTGGAGGDTTTLHPDKEAVILARSLSISKKYNQLTEQEKSLRRQKISDSKKGKSNGHLGMKHSEQTKQLIKNNQPKKTDEWKKSHSAAMMNKRGKPFTQKYKPVIINGIEYPSVKHAMEDLNIKHRATFYNKIKSGLLKVIYK